MSRKRFVGAAGCLVAIVGGLGCQADSDLGTAGAPENYAVHDIPQIVGPDGVEPRPGTLTQAMAQTFVEVVAKDGQNILDMSLTNDFLYFARPWDGLYRVPKYGGAIEVVEGGAGSVFDPITTVEDRVFWVRTRYDKNNRSHIEIKQRGEDGSPTSVLFSGEWSLVYSDTGPGFHADATSLFFVGNLEGSPLGDYYLQQVSRADGSVVRAMEFNHGFAPSWLRTEETTFALETLNTGEQTVFESLGTTARTLASFSGQEVVLGAADHDFLYVAGRKKLWQVAKSDGTKTELVPNGADNIRTLHRRLLVDEAFVYYAQWVDNAWQLLAHPKAGGSPQVLASLGPGTIQKLAQSDRLIYILDDGRIVVVSKPRSTPNDVVP